MKLTILWFQVNVPQRPLVIADWVLGFAVEAPTIPFTFDYVTSGDRANIIDLNLTPGTYTLDSEQSAFAFYGEKVDYSYGAVIDPSECSWFMIFYDYDDGTLICNLNSIYQTVLPNMECWLILRNIEKHLERVRFEVELKN